MPRKRHVSRNGFYIGLIAQFDVMPRKRHVSRNFLNTVMKKIYAVMPRKRHVSRNNRCRYVISVILGHASQEACE